MKKAQTKLDEKRAKEREVWGDEDFLKQVDKPGGRKVVQQVEGQAEKEALRRKADTLTGLENNRGRRFTYLGKLAIWGQNKLEEIEFPEHWQYDCVVTKKGRVRLYNRWFGSQHGLVIVLKAPTGQVYVRAMRISNEPTKDLQLLSNLCVQAENTLDDYKGLLLTRKDAATGLATTKSGIIIPG